MLRYSIGVLTLSMLECRSRSYWYPEKELDR